MKKIVALLLALMMACSLIGVLAESAEVTGEWYLSAIDDGTGERKNPAEYTMEMVMVLNEDGTAASVISMFGDLSASTIKRNFGIKDFGNIIPGHGGVMDRMDSISFVTPLVYFMTVLLVKAFG